LQALRFRRTTPERCRTFDERVNMARKRVAVLISGRGSNMAALLEAARALDYPAEIALVVSNRADAAGLRSAEAAGIVTTVVDHAPFGTDRRAFEQALQTKLDAHRIDLVCLAGFMRRLTPWLVQRWEGRMINIHPSLLPAFKGLDTHARALQAGIRIHGASVHFVAPELDSGAIIAQAAVPVLDSDTPETLAARVLAAEHRIYPLALKLLAQERVRVVDGRCLIDDAVFAEGVLIAPQIG
jgi:phosphoribosylglycinamide formyltransferase 1